MACAACSRREEVKQRVLDMLLSLCQRLIRAVASFGQKARRVSVEGHEGIRKVMEDYPRERL